MSYKNLHECVLDLEKEGHLIRVRETVDPYLEIAEIQRRVYAAQGPALFFEKVKGSPFPAVSNLFGTLERSRFLFRDTLDMVTKIVRLKGEPEKALKHFFAYLGLPFALLNSFPKKVRIGGTLWGRPKGPVLYRKTQISQIPQIQCWPDDGGAFITLPQVYTEDISNPGMMRSNLGMYRIQLSGNEYQLNQEIGLHYQLHRGIGVHHSQALQVGQPLKVSIFVGGPPAHTLAAVMPLPEGLSEILFAGMLAGRRFRYTYDQQGYAISLDADFCITGTVDFEKTLPEGPFGDHLGYYSQTHDFPVLRVESVYHRKNAIWPFTVVGRPPQEDTSFGKLIHEITAPVVSTEIPGVHALHAVDAAGVHPLLLALGSERYVPYQERQPREILTIANAILGFGQCSLAKYLMIAAQEDAPELDIGDISAFFRHVLERIDWRRDLHFQTNTTIDTLDYSGVGFNAGSKVVMAVAGEKKRKLVDTFPADFVLPAGFRNARFGLPGILIVEHQPFVDHKNTAQSMDHWNQWSQKAYAKEHIPLIVVVDDAEFTTRILNNFLWVVFTRSNPSHDLYGVDSFVEYKHWGCHGSLIIDARNKPHHAPPLIEDPKITQKVDRMAASGGCLEGIF